MCLRFDYVLPFCQLLMQRAGCRLVDAVTVKASQMRNCSPQLLHPCHAPVQELAPLEQAKNDDQAYTGPPSTYAYFTYRWAHNNTFRVS